MDLTLLSTLVVALRSSVLDITRYQLLRDAVTAWIPPYSVFPGQDNSVETNVSKVGIVLELKSVIQHHELLRIGNAAGDAAPAATWHATCDAAGVAAAGAGKVEVDVRAKALLYGRGMMASGEEEADAPLV